MTATRSKKPAAPKPRGEAFVRVVAEATLERLADQGFERLTIPDVAQLAGVNKTSIYRRWPDKEALVREALAGVMKHTEVVPDTGSLRGDLLALARTMADATQTRAGKAIFRIALAEGDHALLRALAARSQPRAAVFGPAAVMQRAMARGELKAGVEPTLILFTLAGAILHRVFVEQSEVTDDHLAQLIDLVLLGAQARR
jgi:AcrR family transcriptional regulator